MKQPFLLLFFFCLSFPLFSQNVGINTDGSTPDSTAMLDIKSTSKGLLIPRMTTAQRTGISNAADGLLVFDESTQSFWFHSGASWIELVSSGLDEMTDADGDTKVQVEKNNDEDQVRFDIEGSEQLTLRNNAEGMLMIEPKDASDYQNIFLGYEAGLNTDPSTASYGRYNSFLGYQSGKDNLAGRYNAFFGYKAGESNTSGNSNAYFGEYAGNANRTGNFNLFLGGSAGESLDGGSQNAWVGFRSGLSQSSGDQNSYLGEESGSNKSGGSKNTLLGFQAGQNNSSGSRNVMIGHQAGQNETGNDKLYIDNSNTPLPLIYGDFNSKYVKINGTLRLQDGFSDADKDTKIQVEKGVDDDIIRFDVNGDQLLTLRDNGHGELMINGKSSFSNTFLGYNAGFNTHPDNTDKGKSNTFIGRNAGFSNETGFKNTLLGVYAGEDMVSGTNNSFLGSFASNNLQTGDNNTVVGALAFDAATSGEENVIIGMGAGTQQLSGENNSYLGERAGGAKTGGDRNTLLGSIAGYGTSSGSGHVLIGYGAGYSASGDNKLYIENSTNISPLIYGEFDNDYLAVNGNLSISKGFTDRDNDTKIQVEESFDEDQIRFDLAGVEQLKISTNAHNVLLIEPYGSGSNRGNTFFGDEAGLNTNSSLTLGRDNSFLGFQAGKSNTVGKNNSFLGSYSGYNNLGGERNVFLGFEAGYNVVDGSFNVLVGSNTGNSITSGSGNTFLGSGAGTGIATGGNNTILGYNAGANSSNVGGCVFIGKEAGSNASGNNQLYLANTDTHTPLIYGEFDNKKLECNGDFYVNETAILNTSMQLFFTNNNSPKFSMGYNNTSNYFVIKDEVNNDQILYINNGNVGINRINPSNDFEVNGTASKSSSGDWLANSDARLKKNIQDIPSENILQQLLQLQGITYEWDDKREEFPRPEGIQYGFTAQNIQEVFPELVSEDNEGYLQTAYGTYDAMYVEAIRALVEKIERLEQKVANLETGTTAAKK